MKHDRIDTDSDGIFPIGIKNWEIVHAKNPMLPKDKYHRTNKNLSKTRQHIQVLFEGFGYERFFGRTEVMIELSITASPASALIKKMLNLGIISPMKGKGKGKHLFVRKS